MEKIGHSSEIVSLQAAGVRSTKHRSKTAFTAQDQGESVSGILRSLANWDIATIHSLIWHLIANLP